MRMTNPWTVRTAFLLALLAGGCAARPKLKTSSDNEWFRREERSALDSGHTGERLERFLRREGLSEKAEAEPDRLLEVLDRRLIELGERDVALHLAELAFWRAEGIPYGRGRAGALYFASAEYAFAYLFDESLGPKASPFDASFRQACEYYNRSVAKVATMVRESGKRGGTGLRLPSLRRDVQVERGRIDFDIGLQGFEDFQSCYRYEVANFEGAVRVLGLGAPFFATVALPKPGRPEGSLILDNFARPLPATALVRFEGSIRDPGQEPRKATLDVFDTLKTTTTRIGATEVALETDLTTPLVRTLAVNPGYSGIKAMLDPESFRRFSGLIPVQPFDPERIPLVFVHGLTSSPMTWLRLYQDLLADPLIRTRFQIWAFRYPTGDPILISASRFRAALEEARKTLDPEGKRRALHDIVIVGHSMGGLLTSCQIRTTGDRLWETVTSTPFEDFKIPEEGRALLRPVFFFERNPDIRRVVFMAAPHRGAEMAQSFFGRLGASLVRVAGKIGTTATEFQKALAEDPGAHVPPRFLESMTGIDGLRPDNIILGEIAGWPLPPEVVAHSIVGNHEMADTPGGTDTIVPYWSSHLEGVKTEKIVKSEHNVQERPETICELRRILHEHLAEFDARVGKQAP